MHSKSKVTGIAFSELKYGMIYKLQARNLSYGVFDGDGFIGIRTKFGTRFLDKELEWTQSLYFGTAWAIEEVIPVTDTPIKMTLYVECECCRKRIAYSEEKKDWFHEDGSVICAQASHVAVQNEHLFELLESVETLHEGRK